MADTVNGARNVQLEEAINRLLYHEAYLLDERRYNEWLDLYSEDAIYWVPAGLKPLCEIDPEWEVSLVYDDRNRMEQRVARLNSPYAYTQQPASRTRRVISNVTIALGESEKTCVASSVLCCYEIRVHKMSTFVGRCEHTLVGAGGQWKIAKKVIDLLSRDEVVDSISFIL